MSAVALSVILYASMYSGHSCETVFSQTAKSANPRKLLAEESGYLQELAEAACETNNPDIIWQIVQTESNFRFLIVRQNLDKGARVVHGGKIKRILDRLTQNPATSNVDIGAMQINWTWHKDEFGRQPYRMLQPAAQVAYLVDHWGASIYRRCSGRWVGCYHNPSNARAAQGYEKAIRRHGRLLARETVRFLEQSRQGLEPAVRLPLVARQEIDLILQQAATLPPPVKDSFRLASLLQLEPVKVVFRNLDASG